MLETNPIYLNYLELWDLYGKSYDIIKKATFYQLVAHANRYKPIWFGKEQIDQRIHIFFIMPSGSGKKSIEELNRKTIKRLNTCDCLVNQSLPQSGSNPPSLSCSNAAHMKERFANCLRPLADHLIGKIVRDFIPNPAWHRGAVNVPKYTSRDTTNYGYLYYDFCSFDECHPILVDKDKNDLRIYLRMATDSMLQNEIEKQRVDIPFTQALHYCPECTCVFFLTPTSIEQNVITEGLMRRGLILYVEPTLAEIQTGIDEKIRKSAMHILPAMEQHWVQWIEFLRRCREGTNIDTFKQGVAVFSFSQAVIDAIIIESNKIIDDLVKHSAGAARMLNQSMISDVKKNLMRMSCVLATINNRGDLTEADVTEAKEDLHQFCLNANKFVEDYVQTKNVLQEELKGICNELLNCGATNKQHAIAFNDFIQRYAVENKKPVTLLKQTQLRMLQRRGYVKKVKGRIVTIFVTLEGALFAGRVKTK
jgi:hypothetical protein